MKKKLIYVISLVSVIALNACQKSEKQGEVEVSFITPYQELVIDPIKPVNGKISKPDASASGITIYGYYKDPGLKEPFDFNKVIDEALTLYVKALKGDGSDASPYRIESGLALNSLTHLGETITGKAQITKSIEIYSLYSEEYEKTNFNGTLEGLHNTVTFLNDEDYLSDTGIFYNIGEEGSVSNLKILGHIDASHSSTGALCNFNYGEINNVETVGDSYHNTNGCNVGVSLMTTFDEETGEVVEDFGTLGKLITLNKGGAGGICGTNYGEIYDCINKMMISATIGCGGMAGINYGLIENCFNRGAIGTTGNYSVNSSEIRDPNYSFSYAGGIAGANYGIIHQCVNANQVFSCRLPWLFNNCPAGQDNFSNRIRFGGMAGANFGTYDETEGKYTGGIISECSNLGRIHGDMQVGGIAGYTSGYIGDCFSSSYLGGRSCVGSIAGWMSGDKPNDRIAVVENCVSFARIMKGSFPATIQDKDGTTFIGEELTDSQNGGSNVDEYYKDAKYASKCVYHNNSGNINPIDPKANTNTSITSTAIMAKSVYDQVNVKNGVPTNLWTYRDTSTCTAIAPFSSAWQVYLNVLPKWQEKTITYVTSGTEHKLIAVAGVLYIGNNATSSGSTYSSSLNSSLSCVVPGRGLPTRGLGVEAGPGQVIKWTTVKDDPNYVWDGIVRNDMTIYPIAVDAN